MAKARRGGLQEFTERFGQRVAELRRRHGWTQAKLAEKLDVGDAYVAKLEVGCCLSRYPAASFPSSLWPDVA